MGLRNFAASAVELVSLWRLSREFRRNAATLPQPTPDLPPDAEEFWSSIAQADVQAVLDYMDRQPEAPKWRDKHARATLALAIGAARGNLDEGLKLSEIFLKAGSDRDGAFLAAINGNHNRHPEILDFLFENGYQPDSHDYFSAAKLGHAQGLALCLDNGIPVSTRDDTRFTSPFFDSVPKSTGLHYTACFGREECGGLLLDRKAEMDAQNALLMTPLATAIACANDGFAVMLMDRNASLTLTDRQGNRPLEIAKYKSTQNEYIAGRMTALVRNIEERMVLQGIPLERPARKFFMR